MGKVKQYYETRAELMMMGKTLEVKDESEVEFITDYIITSLGYEEQFSGYSIYEDIHRYNKTNKVTHIGTCRVYGMPCIVYCIDPQDGETPKPFEEDYGSGYPCSFCYVLNLADKEMCSEFGDCFFEKQKDGCYHRVS